MRQRETGNRSRPSVKEEVASATFREMYQVLVIVSIAVWIFGAAGKGALSPMTGALLLIALVALAAFGKAQGWGLIGTIFRVGMPIGSLLTFAIWQGQGSYQAIGEIVFGLLMLALVLYGIYFMIRGAFRKPGRPRKRDTDF